MIAFLILFLHILVSPFKARAQLKGGGRHHSIPVPPTLRVEGSDV
jgi:hypothetical protein